MQTMNKNYYLAKTLGEFNKRFQNFYQNMQKKDC